MGSNSSLSVSARLEVQDWDLLKPASVSSSAGASVERLTEDVPVPSVPSEFSSEILAPKVSPEEAELPRSTSENLIDFTDVAPVLPPVQQPKPVLTPRWIIPSSAPPGIFSNGLLEHDSKPAPVSAEGLALTRSSGSNSAAVQPGTTEDVSKSRGLLTTEL